MATHNELAQAILVAAAFREESFDYVERCWRVSLRDACEAAGSDPLISYPVYLLLANSWNEALEWAELNKM